MSKSFYLGCDNSRIYPPSVPYTGSESEVESEIDKDPKVNPRSSEAQQQPGGADLRRLFYNSSPQSPSCPIIIVLNSII
jgi:hypothetical protein